MFTRLPGDLRLDPADATGLLRQRFAPPLLLGPETAARLPEVPSEHRIAGGAVYVALAAREHGAALATQDGRARDTYDRMGVQVVVAA